MAVRCIYFCISIYKCVTFIALLWMFATSILHFQVCYIWMVHLFYISAQVCYIWMVVRCIYFCSVQLHLQAVAFPPAAVCGEALLRRMRLPSITLLVLHCSVQFALFIVHCTVTNVQWLMSTMYCILLRRMRLPTWDPSIASSLCFFSNTLCKVECTKVECWV